MKISKLLLEYEKVAADYIRKGFIGEVNFSGNTYQVQVFDRETKQEVWTFLQLSEKDELLDGFCSCDADQDLGFCEHLAASYMAIYRGHEQPLHERFLDSLWYRLTYLAFQKLGDDTQLLKRVHLGQYQIKLKKFFLEISAAKGKPRKKLKQIFEERSEETEETSIKFSNLSSEELVAWKRGEPSPELRYELSFWSDLAKWLISLQERSQACLIAFFPEGKLPTGIRVTFDEVTLECSLEVEDLLAIIPTLSTVETGLEIHHLQEEAVEQIVYDPTEVCFRVTMKESVRAGIEGIALDGWIYVPNKGFYDCRQHPLLTEGVIPADQIAFALDTYPELFQSYLKGISVHGTSKTLKTHLSFDVKGNLIISSYLFDPGDLSSSASHYFDGWVYLPERGFYRIEGLGSDHLETMIPRDEVAEFVTVNRGWFNTQSGFRTHLSELDTYVAYTLSDDDNLEFTAQVALSGEKEGEGKTLDFGRWLYVEGEGFFSKKSMVIGASALVGVRVRREEISSFIKKHRDELSMVCGFFANKSPVERVSITLARLDGDALVVEPCRQLFPEYIEAEKWVRFFDDVVYVFGEGFFELPAALIPPEGFHEKRIIAEEEIPVFLAYELPRIRSYIDDLDRCFCFPKALSAVVTDVVKDKMSSEGNLVLRLCYQSELGSVPFSEVWTAMQQGKRYLFSEAGGLDLENDALQWLHQVQAHQMDPDSNSLTLSTLQLLKLHALYHLEIAVEGGKQGRHLFRVLEEMTTADQPDLTGLLSTLRPYQQLGVQWLWFLYRHRLSGMLCDDMGLGKTHQAMALMAAVTNRCKTRKTAKHPVFLIICPTSVLFHWQDKLEEFLPTLRVHTFYGAQRSLERKIQSYDIVLTSYGVVRREVEALCRHKFSMVICDEVQVAKNHQSRIHAALCELKAEMRLGLTGTPIENRLRELKALFDVVLPTYMPGETQYKDLFVTPIEKNSDSKRQELLARYVKPFMLRRRKQDVLAELPTKTEDIAHCGLAGDQKRLYQEILDRSGKGVLKQLEDRDQVIPYVHIFALLSLLKQVCDHPAVYLKEIDRYKEYHCGKWDLFVELLDEARASQQKVVVFSHFLGMMDIIEAYLTEMGIGYASVRGKTRDRREQVTAFQNDPACEVFVGSLQAVGMGIDLTAGSVVIHYDRWWNPARENQATDRVHRIGQQRGVQVFKLVTKDTLEETIDEIIARKQRLFDKVVTADDESVLKRLDRGELIELLRSVHVGSGFEE